MGRLAGFTVAEVTRKLRRAIFEFDRMAKFGRTQLKAAVMIGRQTAR